MLASPTIARYGKFTWSKTSKGLNNINRNHNTVTSVFQYDKCYDLAL